MKDYLGYEILACSKHYIIVYDNEYNYLVFNPRSPRALSLYKVDKLPSNQINQNILTVHYYSSFDGAIKRLIKNEIKYKGGK